MNVNEVLTYVYGITKRPDKSSESLLALNKAVSYLTLLGDFEADRVESTIAINATLYGDTISLTSLTRFRRFTYIKPTGKLYYITKTAEDQIFIPKNQMQVNKYFIAGTSLTYTLSELSASLEVGYLTYPIPLDTTVNVTHWMLEQIPYSIIDLASAYVFANIGDDASAAKHQKSGMELFLAMRRDKNQE
jgi:hypothetical protein